MAMKNPSHPGAFVRRQIVDALGLSVSAAAALLRVRRATLSDLLHGKAKLSAEMALRIEEAFGVSMDMLLRMQAGHDAARARARRRSGKPKIARYVPDARE
jgi:antitoxin HigA-1